MIAVNSIYDDKDRELNYSDPCQHSGNKLRNLRENVSEREAKMTIKSLLSLSSRERKKA